MSDWRRHRGSARRRHHNPDRPPPLPVAAGHPPGSPDRVTRRTKAAGLGKRPLPGMTGSPSDCSPGSGCPRPWYWVIVSLVSTSDKATDVGHAADARTGRKLPDLARLRRLTHELAALRRVATLVANGARPGEVFTAVADELGRLIGAEAVFVSRVDQSPGERGDPTGYTTVVGSYGQIGRASCRERV